MLSESKPAPFLLCRCCTSIFCKPLSGTYLELDFGVGHKCLLCEKFPKTVFYYRKHYRLGEPCSLGPLDPPFASKNHRRVFCALYTSLNPYNICDNFDLMNVNI